jgi:hypothetical protein
MGEKASEIGLLMGDEDPKLVAPAPTTAASRPRRAGGDGEADEAEGAGMVASTAVLDAESEDEDEEVDSSDEISLESLGEAGLGSIEDVEP